MPDKQRNNLVKVANKYPKMKPEEQRRVRERLSTWATLTPEQRDMARQSYRKLKQQPPHKQQEVKQKWQAYQAEKAQAAPAGSPHTLEERD